MKKVNLNPDSQYKRVNISTWKLCRPPVVELQVIQPSYFTEFSSKQNISMCVFVCVYIYIYIYYIVHLCQFPIQVYIIKAYMFWKNNFSLIVQNHHKETIIW